MRANRIIRVTAPAMLAALLLAHPATSAAKQRGGDERARRREDRTRRNEMRLEMERVTRLMADRRYEEAAVVLELLKKRRPEQTAAAELLTRCYLLTGRPRKAIAVLEELLADKPDRFSYLRDLGQAWLDLGEKEKAVKAWERVLTDDASKAGYYGIVANLEKESGLYEEALVTLRKGRRFPRHDQRYTMEIVKLEKLLGRHDDAFRDGLSYLAVTKAPSLDQAVFLFDIFRGANQRDSLLADTEAMAGGTGRGLFFRKLHALLAIEADHYEPARAIISAGKERKWQEKDLFEFVLFLSSMEHRKEDPGFRGFLSDAYESYLERHPNAPGAPVVLLMTAVRRRERAVEIPRFGAAPDTSMTERREPLLREAIGLCDRALAIASSAPYRERILLFKAEIQLDDLGDPAAALATLDGYRFRTSETIREMAMMQMRALIAAGDRRAAEPIFAALAERTDSTIASIGAFGLGKLRFLEGRYEDAVDTLSGFAARYPWSELANDALDLAMLIKGSMTEDEAALDGYRSALLDFERRRYSAAIDTLSAVTRRSGDSGLLPRILYLRARAYERSGRSGDAARDLTGLAERFPLHELAPRSLELLAEKAARESPAAAARWYGEIIERYPDDPFLERIRGRYVELRRELDDGRDER